MEKGLKELREEVLDTDACTGCGTCIYLCPNLKSVDDRIAVIADCDLAPGSCYRYCPRTPADESIQDVLFGDAGYGGAVAPYLQYFMGRNSLKLEGGSFQYGGVVTALLLTAMEKKLINRAIVTNSIRNLPIPSVVKNRQDIMGAAGSKFALSPTNREANHAIMNVENTVGVVALPCQATGLKKRRLLPRNDEMNEGKIGLIIGLFCTWALSQDGWRALLGNYLGNEEIIRTDIPPPPENIMRIITNKKVHEIPLETVRQYVRPGCRVCVDMTAENADISVGMVEGLNKYSTVIVRTPEGKKVLDEAIRSGKIKTEPLEEVHWIHLNEAALNKKKRAIAEAKIRKADLPYYQRIKDYEKKFSN